MHHFLLRCITSGWFKDDEMSGSHGLKGQRLDASTCWASCSWCRYSTSDASAPQTARPCRCRSAHPTAKRANNAACQRVFRKRKSYEFVSSYLLSSVVTLRVFFLSQPVCVCVCVGMQAEVKVCSYITAVWLLAGQFLKRLKCGHTPHVTGRIGFRLKTQVGNVSTFSTCFLLFLDLVSVTSHNSLPSLLHLHLSFHSLFVVGNFLLQRFSTILVYSHIHLKSRCADSDLHAVYSINHMCLFSLSCFLTSGLWLQAGFLWRSHCDQRLQLYKIPEEYNPSHPVQEKEKFGVFVHMGEVCLQGFLGESPSSVPFFF